MLQSQTLRMQKKRNTIPAKKKRYSRKTAVHDETFEAPAVTAEDKKATANAEAKVKAKTTAKAQVKVKAKATAKVGEEISEANITSPFRLRNRSKPLHLAQSYLMGTIGDAPYKLVTGISVRKTPDFTEIMQALLKECEEGKITTEWQAVQRRDELVAVAAPAVTADADTDID